MITKAPPSGSASSVSAEIGAGSPSPATNVEQRLEPMAAVADRESIVEEGLIVRAIRRAKAIEARRLESERVEQERLRVAKARFAAD